jgi:hypothetical protein
VVGDPVRHRAEQEAAGAGHPLVADDDQVRVALLGDVEDRVGRIALAGEGLDLDARLADAVGGLAERGVDLLARVDHPLQVAGRLTRLLAQARLGDRLVGGHQADGRAERLGEVDGLGDRLAGRVGSVGAHDDRAEHGRDHKDAAAADRRFSARA